MLPRHQRNPTSRFTGRGEWYHASRPSLPVAMIDAVLDGFDRSHCTIADFGAGTGLSAHAFALALGGSSRILAIEPNADMQRGAPTMPRVEWITATAEETPLADASIDVAISVTAFHWFSPQRAPQEIARVLRPGGRLAVMVTDRESSDPIGNEFHRIMGEHESGINAGNILQEYGHAFVPGLYSPAQLVSVENPQEYDLERMLARGRSSSYVSTDEAALQVTMHALKKFWEQHVDARGVVTIKYRTTGLLAVRLALGGR